MVHLIIGVVCESKPNLAPFLTSYDFNPISNAINFMLRCFPDMYIYSMKKKEIKAISIKHERICGGAKTWTFMLGLKPHLLTGMRLMRRKCLEKPHSWWSTKNRIFDKWDQNLKSLVFRHKTLLFRDLVAPGNKHAWTISRSMCPDNLKSR